MPKYYAETEEEAFLWLREHWRAEGATIHPNAPTWAEIEPILYGDKRISHDPCENKEPAPSTPPVLPHTPKQKFRVIHDTIADEHQEHEEKLATSENSEAWIQPPSFPVEIAQEEVRSEETQESKRHEAQEAEIPTYSEDSLDIDTSDRIAYHDAGLDPDSFGYTDEETARNDLLGQFKGWAGSQRDGIDNVSFLKAGLPENTHYRIAATWEQRRREANQKYQANFTVGSGSSPTARHCQGPNDFEVSDGDDARSDVATRGSVSAEDSTSIYNSTKDDSVLDYHALTEEEQLSESTISAASTVDGQAISNDTEQKDELDKATGMDDRADSGSLICGGKYLIPPLDEQASDFAQKSLSSSEEEIIDHGEVDVITPISSNVSGHVSDTPVGQTPINEVPREEKPLSKRAAFIVKAKEDKNRTVVTTQSATNKKLAQLKKTNGKPDKNKNAALLRYRQRKDEAELQAVGKKAEADAYADAGLRTLNLRNLLDMLPPHKYRDLPANYTDLNEMQRIMAVLQALQTLDHEGEAEKSAEETGAVFEALNLNELRKYAKPVEEARET